MELPSHSWKIPLGEKPELCVIGKGVHGKVPSQERYLLDGLWCLHFYHYEANIVADGLTYPIRPGFVSLFPPGTPLVFNFDRLSRHLYVHFRLRPSRANCRRVPAMQDLGAVFPAVHDQMEEVLGFHSVEPRRAEARLWDVLWELATALPGRGGPGQLHPALRNSLQLIEAGLEDVIIIPELAREVQMSHNHLIRLFRARFNMTIEGYIRDRRIKRALHLLRHSTATVKSIAAEVGLPDLHQFNKAIRRACGRSPREISKSRLR